MNLSNQIQLRERASYSYCARSRRQQTYPSRSRVKNVIKQLVHTSAVRSSRYEAFESITNESTLTHLSSFPNFPRASYLDERTLTYETIVNFTPGNRASKMLVLSPDTGSNTKGFQVKQTL